MASCLPHKRSDPISVRVTALKERLGWQKAAVALANKNARILLAVMTKKDAFDAKHCPRRPKSDHPCRLNIDQGWKAARSAAICG